MHRSFRHPSLIFLIICFCCSRCDRRNATPQSDKKPASKSTYVISDSSIFKPGSGDLLTDLVNIYSDSINKASRLGILPSFLDDRQLDYGKAALSLLHYPAPIRKMIFDKVTNCESLRMITMSVKGSYKNHPRKESGIDVEYLKFSMWDFAMKRYQELGCR